MRYFVTDRGVPGVDADQFRDAIARAFDTWRQVPGAGASFEFVGFTSADPFEDDGMNVLGFEDRPELERVLGATTYLVDTVTGDILESDIFFNSAFDWSVAPGGETGREDVQSIATHEIGHLLGLGHSALGETELRPGGGRRVIAAESVMFPIAYSAGSIESRTLKPDDVAGVSDIYGAAGFRTETGSVSGRVTRDGRGVFGAHVVAFDLRRGTLVGNFSLDADGQLRHRRPRAGPARAARRAARRRRPRELLRRPGPRGPRFRRDLPRSARGRAARRVDADADHCREGQVRRAAARRASSSAGPGGRAGAGPVARAARRGLGRRAVERGLRARRAAGRRDAQPDGGRRVHRSSRRRAASTAARGAELRIGVRLGRRLALEAGGSWARASVATRVSGDAEQAPGVSATAGFTQYVVDGAVVLRLPRLAFAGGRAVPFAEAGAGYLRQLYAGRVLVETGSVVHAGGGLHVWLRSRPAGWLKRVGVRADGRLAARRGGIDLAGGGGRARVYGVLSAGLAVVTVVEPWLSRQLGVLPSGPTRARRLPWGSFGLPLGAVPLVSPPPGER